MGCAQRSDCLVVLAQSEQRGRLTSLCQLSASRARTRPTARSYSSEECSTRTLATCRANNPSARLRSKAGAMDSTSFVEPPAISSTWSAVYAVAKRWMASALCPAAQTWKRLFKMHWNSQHNAAAISSKKLANTNRTHKEGTENPSRPWQTTGRQHLCHSMPNGSLNHLFSKICGTKAFNQDRLSCNQQVKDGVQYQLGHVLLPTSSNRAITGGVRKILAQQEYHPVIHKEGPQGSARSRSLLPKE